MKRCHLRTLLLSEKLCSEEYLKSNFMKYRWLSIFLTCHNAHYWNYSSMKNLSIFSSNLFHMPLKAWDCPAVNFHSERCMRLFSFSISIIVFLSKISIILPIVLIIPSFNKKIIFERLSGLVFVNVEQAIEVVEEGRFPIFRTVTADGTAHFNEVLRDLLCVYL